MVWLSGAPGMGKSTSAQILGRDKGYVYYEADTFGLMKNPFLDLNTDNPSMSQWSQKKLKGICCADSDFKVSQIVKPKSKVRVQILVKGLGMTQ